MDLGQTRLFKNIYLIGYRCTGKTRVGRILSKRLGLSFVDMDVEITNQEKKTISEMVHGYGWEYFRKIEKEVLKQLASNTGQVIATGGGIVLDSHNIQMIKDTGVAVWLKASPGIIEKRMALDPATRNNRPSLTEKEQAQEIEDTLKERISLYERAMDFSVDTDLWDIETTCSMIVSQLKGMDNYLVGEG